MEHSKDFPDCFYRVSIKGVCVRNGKVLLIQESEAHSGGEWELPGGGLDFGEDPRTGFKREVAEEMGIQIVKMSEQPVYIWTHKYMNRRNMEWYYNLIIAYRVEFADLEITPTDECGAVEFYTKDELPGLKLTGSLKVFSTIFNPVDFASDF